MEISNPSTQNVQVNPKKRSFSDSNVVNNIQDSTYFKIRSLVKDLRPHFIQVLQTPDFQTSKAASEINHQMKVLMKLYEEMTSNTTMEKCKNVVNNVDDEKKPTDIKPTLTEPPLEKEKTFVRKPSEERPASIEDVSHGSYIVGGSAFGWNFITYPSSKFAAYYGTTKEDYRAANPIPPSVSENVE